jgi:tetratricopeptide (TPR) repeat protein
MLAGEICYREGQMTRAFDYLREAVRKEDMLRYSEPPDWLIPSRHALGAALLQSREYRDAEEVYREDLRRRPENGWSLFGLARSLQGQGKSAEARLVSARLQKAWRHADFKLSSSCCCLPETRKASQITDAIPSD